MTVAVPPLLVWRWLPALAGLVAATPAVLVTGLVDVRSGVVLGVGMIPSLVIGIPRDRRRRVLILAASLILGVPITVGATVSPWPVLACTTMFLLPVVATWGGPRLHRPRLALLLIILAPPLVGIGLSLDGWRTGVTITGLFIAGGVITFAVAVALPEHWLAEPADGPVTPTALPGIPYGVLVGLVGLVAATIGFLLDLDHVGWACAAALLVMRPDALLQQWRTMGRFVSVLVGASAATGLVELGVAPWAVAVAVAVALVAAAATRGSRWYILPTFTTFLVILMLSYPDPAQATGRLTERVSETVLGLVVAAVVGIGGSALIRRRDHASAP
ncbi:FUSC family protein [Gordonia sp. ABSL11-1]|uniref:FUSC family protein n=1 Tax=Gordonia sp. ABSL11-1 TaxID=3053924 RepID=UPI0025729433|nr:FUSC family protein [Gordonia sp. ABSL11-1]MDL9947060.1 FUSC family protein [Gordonia sp. ABSL11-1]